MMNRKTISVCSIAFLIAACSESSNDEVDAEPLPVVDTLMSDGKRVFSSCASCHTINQGGASTIGPNLWGVFHSEGASKTDFVYSDALKNSGVVWNEESLDKYLTNPGEYLPGGTMAFPGIPAEEDRKAVLAFLLKVSTDSSTGPAVPSQQGEPSAIWE